MRGVNLDTPGTKNSLKSIKRLVPLGRHRLLVKWCISGTEVCLAIAELWGLGTRLSVSGLQVSLIHTRICEL